MKAKNKLWNWCLRLEHHLCPDYCGVVDRRRVIAFVLLTLVEILIIPYHFLLFYIMDAWGGMLYNVVHTLALALLMYVVLKRKVVFKTGISLLYILVFVKLAIDSMLCLHYQGDRDNLSVMKQYLHHVCTRHYCPEPAAQSYYSRLYHRSAASGSGSPLAYADLRAALQHQGCSGRFPDDSLCMAL